MTNDPTRDPPLPPQKKPYGRPTMIVVPLRPDEAVLGTCKNSRSAGPFAATCAVTVCSSQGS